MYLLLSIALFLSISGQLDALSCFGQTCNTVNQYCQIQIHDQTGFCYTHHGHGHHEDHQKCIGMHHPGDHCFCREQSCVDTMAAGFTNAPTNAPTQAATAPPAATTQAQTAPPAATTQAQTPVPTVLHIEAIPCAGKTCYTPQVCQVTFVNSMPLAAKCATTTISHCGPFPTNGDCECDSKFCMDIINSYGTLGLTTAQPIVTTAAGATTASTMSTSPATTPIVTCADKEDAGFTCQAYNDQFGMCLSNTATLQTIARNRCPKFCGFCGNNNGTIVTQSPVVGATTTVPPCIDHDPRCTESRFQSLLCSAATPETKKFAVSTCAKSCNLCQEYIASLSPPVSCNVCGDVSTGIPCPLADIYRNDTAVKCDADKSFCMTDLYQDPKGNKDVYKRCVDATTCQTKWIGESADLDYCSNYGNVVNAAQFECHFCCSGDMCNTNIKPSQSTLVAKPTG